MNTDRDIVLISIFTFCTVLIWIFFELVKTNVTSTIPTDVQRIISPLPTTIDQELIKNLEKRNVY